MAARRPKFWLWMNMALWRYLMASSVLANCAAAAANAEVVAEISRLPWSGFGPGTEGGKAKPEIWKEQAKFKELSERLMADTDKLVLGAKAGNLDALKAAVGAAGDTCKTCHDTFRNK